MANAQVLRFETLQTIDRGNGESDVTRTCVDTGETVAHRSSRDRAAHP